MVHPLPGLHCQAVLLWCLNNFLCCILTVLYACTGCIGVNLTLTCLWKRGKGARAGSRVVRGVRVGLQLDCRIELALTGVQSPLGRALRKHACVLVCCVAVVAAVVLGSVLCPGNGEPVACRQGSVEECW